MQSFALREQQDKMPSLEFLLQSIVIAVILGNNCQTVDARPAIALHF
jgi:hypothetical protein